MKLDNVEDDVLIDLLRQGVNVAMEELLRRYKYYSWKLAYLFLNEHPNSGIALEEFHQEAFGYIIPALKNYSGNDCTFYSFWKSGATNAMRNYYRENAYTAKGWVFAGISLDEADNEEDFSVAEKHGRSDIGMQSGILKEELQMMFDDVMETFKKDNDVIIINLFIEGYSFEDIQRETNASKRHVYYVIDRFQKLFSELIKKRNYN